MRAHLRIISQRVGKWYYRALIFMKKNKRIEHSLWVTYVKSSYSTIAIEGVKTILAYNRWFTRRYLQVSAEVKQVWHILL
jgi:hypothetical protein